MSFFSNLTSKLLDAANAGLETLKATPIPIALSEDVLNQAASQVIRAKDEIESLNLAMHDGWFRATAKVNHKLANFDATIDFEIVRFEIDKQNQVIQLRQRGKVETNADGWRNKIIVYVITAIISSILGKNPLHWALKGQDGITFTDDLITVDLAKIGAKDALYAAMVEKIGERASFLLPTIQGSTDSLADYVSIKGAECVEGALKITVSLLRMNSDGKGQ